MSALPDFDAVGGRHLQHLHGHVPAARLLAHHLGDAQAQVHRIADGPAFVDIGERHRRLAVRDDQRPAPAHAVQHALGLREGAARRGGQQG
jgi:hypothetical protein